MVIKRRTQDLIPPFKPPTKTRVTEEDVSREHTNKLFSGASDVFKDVADILDKHLDRNKKALIKQVLPKLGSVRQQIPASQRVRDNITDSTILNNALKDPAEMKRLRELTGISASTGDLNFIKRYIKEASTTTPVQNHLDFIDELGQQHGFAKLHEGKIVRTDLGALFKQQTGKAMDSLVSKKHLDVALKKEFLNSSATLLANGVGSGSISYAQGLEQAAEVYGKGTTHYETVKQQMFNAHHARLAKFRAMRESDEDNHLAKEFATKFDFGDLGKGLEPRPGESVSERRAREGNRYRNAVGAIVEEFEKNRADISDYNAFRRAIIAKIKGAKGIGVGLRRRITQEADKHLMRMLDEGLEVYLGKKLGKGAGMATAPTPLEIEQLKRQALAEYVRYTSFGGKYFTGFGDLPEHEKARVTLNARGAVANYIQSKRIPRWPEGLEDYGVPEELAYKYAFAQASGNKALANETDVQIQAIIDAYRKANPRPAPTPVPPPPSLIDRAKDKARDIFDTIRGYWK